MFGIARSRTTANRKSLRAALEAGLVVLQYKKVTANGANRFAIATLNPALYRYSFKGGAPPAPRGLIRYWDFGVQGWRSSYVYNIESWAPMTL